MGLCLYACQIKVNSEKFGAKGRNTAISHHLSLFCIGPFIVSRLTLNFGFRAKVLCHHKAMNYVTVYALHVHCMWL